MVQASLPRPASPPFLSFGWPFVVASAAALVVLVVSGAASTQLGAYWAIGLALGVILQRSRFCFAGAFRDLIMSRDGRLMRAVLAGLMLSTAGFWLLMARFVPDPSFGTLPPQAHILPVGLNLVVGGVLFGIGMVIAGGCISGTLFRIGEGYVGSIVALAGILGGLSLAAHSWNWWWQNAIRTAPTIWLPGVVGHGAALLLVMGLLVALYLIILWIESLDGPPPAFGARATARTATAFGERLAAFRERWFRQGWPVAVGGLALGMLNILSYSYDHPIGVTGELSNWAEHLTGLFGLSSGPLLGVDQFAGCNLAVGGEALVTPSLTLDLGLIAGSFIAALGASEFKLRFPRRPSRYVQQVVGGVAMGYGAGIALGCTLGNFFSSVPSLAVSGWVFGIFLGVGAFLGTILIRRLP